MLKLLRNEAQVPAAWITAALFLIFGAGWFAAAANNTGLTLILFAWLFAAILWGAFGVVRHAEHLAERLGEPYGTLILTMSVTIIEVAFIVTAIATGSGSSPVARDAVFAVVMIMLNGTIGLCLLLGGLRHHEQSYNLPGARAFLSVVIPLAVFALILPNYTVMASGPVLSTPQAINIAILTLALYGVFLTMQTVRHRSFFQDVEPDSSALPEEVHTSAHPTSFHVACLVLTLLPAVYLTEELGHIVEHAVKAMSAPAGLAGVVVAVLVLAPEAMGALQSALRNRLQRAVNIALGSVLATIGLTIPTVLVLGVLKGTPTILGLGDEQMVLLAVTLVVSTLTFGGDRTNMLQGAVHIVMFLVFGLLLFHP
jgi:Ca2+:H+ antiporter